MTVWWEDGRYNNPAHAWGFVLRLALLAGSWVRSHSSAPTDRRPTHSSDYPLDVDLMPLIEVRAGIRGGKPCFVGTRIAVYDVLEYLASGMTTIEIVRDFPELTEMHVRAAIEFAAIRERRLATPA
jgi:uncharacterized protein (DUF433 family)